MIHTGQEEMQEFCNHVSEVTGGKTKLVFESNDKKK